MIAGNTFIETGEYNINLANKMRKLILVVPISLDGFVEHEGMV